MEQIFSYFGHWTWFIIGVLLLLLELMLPGMVIVWFGAAAIGVGLLDLIIPMNWQVEFAVFSILSVVLLVIGRPIVTRRINTESEQPNLNQRNREFIGKRYKLTEALKDGQGSLNINDTRWRIRGDDVPKGGWVRVTGVDGLELLVEPDGE